MPNMPFCVSLQPMILEERFTSSRFYIPKCAAALLFDTPGVKGENKDKMVKVKWQDDFTTDSRFIYYGQGTRNEYRITRFGKGFLFWGRQCRRFAHYCPTERRLLLWFRLADRSGHWRFLCLFQPFSGENKSMIDVTQASTPEKQLEIGIQELVALYIRFPEPGKWLNSPETYITKLIISRTFIFASFPMNNY